jgi:putative two-component system response regulator
MPITQRSIQQGTEQRVLVVDDDIISAELLANFLTSSGYRVEIAENGKEALEKMRVFSPRIVISDVEMPEMDGIQLCRAIRARPSTRYTYVILLTSRSAAESVLVGLDAGADDYLCKPFHQEELRLRLEGGKRLLSLEGRDMMIFSMAKLAESRDTDTGTHLERIREYCKVLAVELMKLPKYAEQIDIQFVELIYLTSPLHDIGKVGIPDAILQKPGKLTPEEFDAMKRHTHIGGATLAASSEAYPDAGFLKMALDIALMHHERWDGKGYPFGIAGEAIPLAARIVSVADVYDALTTKRVYKEAFSHAVSAKIILEGRGTQFDPDVVDAFERVQSTIEQIRCDLDEDTDPAPSASLVVPSVLSAAPTALSQT